jgi:hypothetical protein
MTANRDEIRRLREGPKEVLPAGYFIVSFMAHCAGNAAEVLDRCKEVLHLVLQPDSEVWPSTDEWRSILPEWFVEKSREELSQQEEERELQLPLKERIRLNERWSVGAFLHWFQPSERYWYWWDAVVQDANTLHIKVIADDVPFPSGSLDWLLRASGALSVDYL